MQFSSLFLLSVAALGMGMTSAQDAASASTSNTAASSLELPQEAIDYVFQQSGVDLNRRTSPLISRMARMSESNKQRRQDNINVNGDCSQGKAQCCDTTFSGDKAETLSSLVGLDNLAGQVGINCVNLPINVIGVSGSLSNICKSTPVCCQNVTQNGLINMGCTALPIN